MEHLWADVQGRFAHLRADLAELEGRVAARAHALSDRMHHLGEDLLHGMHLDAVAQGLTDGLAGLQEGFQHTVRRGARGRGARGARRGVRGRMDACMCV